MKESQTKRLERGGPGPPIAILMIADFHFGRKRGKKYQK